jgi:hypothetical protein
VSVDFAIHYFQAALSHPLGQLIGFVGIVLGTAWPLFENRTRILAMQTLCFFVFVVHFQLLGAHTGVWLNVISGLQAAAAIPLGRHPLFRYIYIATLPAVAAGVVLTWSGFPSAFAGLGVLFTSISRYQQDVVKLRIFSNLGLLAWLGHNVLVYSVPGSITDFGGIASNLFMLRRRPFAPAAQEAVT